jgi:uncharacterized protein (TIGR00369 family)
MSAAPASIAALFAATPYAEFLGVEAAMEGDELILTLPFKPALIGNAFIQAIHGGVLGSFLEFAATAQLTLTREGANVRKPIDVQVEYLRSAAPQTLYAAARVVRIGRRVAHVQAEAWQDVRAKPVALLQADFLVDEAAV